LPLRFDKGSAYATVGDEEQLRAVTFELKAALAATGRRIEVGGHTSSEGSEAHNLELGRRRAQAAVRYLVEHGLPENRLEVKSYGASVPPPPSASDRNAGRRVTVRILE
jgi:outer membrane protein OmpA-like peptidoglycan-associated protein